MTQEKTLLLGSFFLLHVFVAGWAQVRAAEEPSNIEQLLIYDLNPARNKPARFDRENGLSLNLTDVAPQPPLAVNNNLVGSAGFHAEEMATFNYFAHQSAVTLDWPNKMARDNGYVLPNFYSDTSNNIESLAAGTFLSTGLSALNLLIVDAGLIPPGHRIHLLGMSAFFQTHREIGAGHAFNAAANFDNYWAIHTAVRNAGGNQFLTGVVYNDANGNRRYDLGEGLGGVTVGNGVTSVQTNSAGGWAIAVNPGVFNVTASGGGFVGIGSAAATVASNVNVEVDFVSGDPIGEVNFSRQDTGSAADLDGDKRTDVAVYEANAGHWFFVGSTSGFGTHLAFGGPGFIPVPGDYDGDGENDTAVYDTVTGNWFIAQSTAGFRVHPSFGGFGFVPVPGDYDGDGRTDLGVYQVSTGHWFFVRSTLGFGNHLGFGGPGFVPVPGDYDGDGRTDRAVYDTATGNWFISQSSAGFRVHPSFGGPGFIPLPGDYDGDGKTDVAVYQGATGHWFFVGSTSGFGNHLSFGGAGFIPVPGDYDRDGQTDTAVYHTTMGNWFIAQSTAGFRIHPSFGGSQFVPVLPQVTILRAMGLL